MLSPATGKFGSMASIASSGLMMREPSHIEQDDEMAKKKA